MKCKTGKIDLASNVEFEDACTDCSERFGCETCKDKFMETDENNCFEDCENCKRKDKETECKDFGYFPPKDECSGICHLCPRNMNCDFSEDYDDNCDDECEGCEHYDECDRRKDEDDESESGDCSGDCPACPKLDSCDQG